MPDHRLHRGPHPQDGVLFAASLQARLQTAVAHLSGLLGHGYSETAAAKLVGDHFQLQRRQRLAVRRAACAPLAARQRQLRRLDSPAGLRVAVDGFNLLVTLEAALAGGVLLRGVDGLLRDMASVHGSYRGVQETEQALDLLMDSLKRCQQVRWFFDRPVSNSGRMAARVRRLGAEAQVVDNADRAIRTLCEREPWVAATADGPLLDSLERAVDLAGPLVRRLPDAWVLELGGIPPVILNGARDTPPSRQGGLNHDQR